MAMVRQTIVHREPIGGLGEGRFRMILAPRIVWVALS